MSYRYPVTTQLIIDYISFDMLDGTAYSSCGRWDLISSHKSTVHVPCLTACKVLVYIRERTKIPQSLTLNDLLRINEIIS